MVQREYQLSNVNENEKLTKSLKMLYFKSITKYDDYSPKVKVQKQQNIKLQYWHRVTPKKPTKKYDGYAIDKIINDQKLKDKNST